MIGFINTLAGGGMLIAMPILAYLGLPTQVANATLRLSILLQTIGSVFSFYQIGYYRTILPIRSIARNLLPLICGAIIGSYFSTQIDPEIFRRIIAIVMIFLAISSVFRHDNRTNAPKKQRGDTPQHAHSKMRKLGILSYLYLLIIGLYAGLIQGGVGFVLIIFCMTYLGLTAISANAFKVIAVLSYSIFCVPIFLRSGLVRIDVAIIIGLATFAGSWLSVRVQTRLSSKILRRIVLAIIAIAGVAMLYRSL